MGNTNNEEPKIKEWQIKVYRYSNFYGRHQIKDSYVVKRYQLLECQKDAFLGLIQSYQKIEHPTLIKIEDMRLVNDGNGKYCCELDFPYYPKNLAIQIKQRKDKKPFAQQQIANLILALLETLIIFQQKQFPYGCLSPDQIAVKEFHQGYSLGLEILMNTKNIETNQHPQSSRQAFLSPEEKQICKYPGGFDKTKSAVFSVGLVALSAIVFEELEHNKLQSIVFQLRKQYSYQLCNLLKSMLHLDNFNRISLEESMESCRDLLQNKKCNDEINDKIFIRGYNCIESMWLFEEKKEENIYRRWKQKLKQK